MENTGLEFRFYYITNKYDEVVSFYRDGLELEIVGGWVRGIGDRGTIFRAPHSGGLIEIELGMEGPPTHGGVYIEVNNVDDWYNMAKTKGLNISREIANTSYGHRSFRLVDPGGLEVGFFSKVNG